MSGEGVEGRLLHAWLAARSIARGLPAPVPDRGGYRVDTDDGAEIRRWVFAHMAPGLAELARTIDRPGHLLKLCGAAEALGAVLPDRWRLHAPGYFMQAGRPPEARPLPPGYGIETERDGARIHVRIVKADGVAASGHAVETDQAFVYDRIVTAPEHRRWGLGSAVMAALHRARRVPGTPELLVATADGRALYAALGWRTVSPYSTASIPDAGRPA